MKDKQGHKISVRGIVVLIIQTILFVVCCTTMNWNPLALFLAIFLYLSISVIEFFIFCRAKEETEHSSHSHLYPFGFFEGIELDEKYELDEQCQILLDRCYKLEKLSQLHPEQNEHIVNLEIPVPERPSISNELPYKDYIDLLKRLPEQNQCIQGIGQFISLVHPKEELVDFAKTLISSLQYDTSVWLDHSVDDISDFLKNTIQKLIDGLTFQYPEIWKDFFTNFLYAIHNDFNSPLGILIIKFKYAEGDLLGVLLADIKDASFATFSDFDSLHSLNLHFHDYASDIVETISNSALDLDIFYPDFNYELHFPTISAVRCAFKQLDKLIDEKIDLETAGKNFVIKVGVKYAGAAAGAAIGSVIPVIGTLVGSFVGGFIGARLADNIIRKDYEEAVADYKEAVAKYNKKKHDAQNELAVFQVGVDKEIRNQAEKERERFAEIKSIGPFNSEKPVNAIYALSVAIQDYQLNLYFMCSKEFRKRNWLGYGLVSKEGRSCRKLLKHLHFNINKVVGKKFDSIETLELLLSTQMIIKNNQSIIMKFGTVKNHLQYSDIITDGLEKTEESLRYYNMIIFLWYCKVFKEYRASVTNIFKITEEQFKLLQEKYNDVGVYLNQKYNEIVKPIEERVAREKEKI